jgi:RES domain-containing protein
VSIISSYRIFKTKYERTWFDAEGAFLYGGRWNSPGNRVLYTSSSIALALLEVIVHLQDDRSIASYSTAKVDFDGNMVIDVSDFAKLPRDWDKAVISSELREIGDEWAASQRSAVLRVPSVIVPSESNFLINMNHPDAKKLRMGRPKSFKLDQRITKKG